MGLGDKGVRGQGVAAWPVMPGGRGVLEDKQGWQLPSVLGRHSQGGWGKQRLLCLGVLGTWGAAPVAETAGMSQNHAHPLLQQ